MDRSLADFVSARFAEAHSATPSLDYSRWCRIDDERSVPKATLGYRLAADGPLFLEAYLNAPVEEVVSAALDRPIRRTDIVEIGCLAAERSPALVKLWRDAVAVLSALDEAAGRHSEYLDAQMSAFCDTFDLAAAQSSSLRAAAAIADFMMIRA